MLQQLAPNTLLHGGTYKIEKVLGQGSFGITYLAEHINLNRKVAIKEFFMKELNSRKEDGSITGLTDGSLSYNYALKFRKEAQNLARMDYPNIVRVNDCFDENGTFYYVMDYIEGQDLNSYLKQHAISETEAVSIITDVANAIIYMHEEKHMLHLDLKPGNIMRRNDGHIFLIDFGLSKHFDANGAPETSTTIGLGTAGYAPIEQANQAKSGEFRPTIDVYALGATLYKLLTGQTPPAASDIVSDDVLLAESLEKYNVNRSLVNVIEKAMMPSVKKRTQSVRAFIESLPNSNNTTSSPTIITNNIETEETVYINNVQAGEETILINQRIEKHPNFNESTYIITTDYKNFPVVTGHKANSNDKEAMLALGMMALRGEGVIQDFDTAYAWFQKLRDAGDDRGEKMIAQWATLKYKYQSASKTSTTEKASDKGSIPAILWIIVILIIALIIIII